jgi:precorrin-3B C17-methyltransferase
VSEASRASEAPPKGWLTVVGLGPGEAHLTTPAAARALAEATDLVGYGPYLDRVPPGSDGQRRHASDNRVELERAGEALRLAAQGRRVAVVSGGDPGVFAMAAAVFEAIEAGDATWRAIDVRVEPGVTAMLAAAAEVGAPLGGDFCAISLSDNLKSWATIARRLRAAAEADFVIALYNPASQARPDQIRRAFAVLSLCRSPETIVVFARGAGRDNESVEVTTLARAPDLACDMRTLVIIGSEATRTVHCSEGRTWVYTPRSAKGDR